MKMRIFGFNLFTNQGNNILLTSENVLRSSGEYFSKNCF